MGKIAVRRVKAFALPETIVALVILLVVFGIGTYIIAGTGRLNLSTGLLHPAEVLRGYVYATTDKKAFYNADEEIEGYWIKREVSGYAGCDSVWRMDFYLYDKNRRLLEEWKMLVPAGEK